MSLINVKVSPGFPFIDVFVVKSKQVFIFCFICLATSRTNACTEGGRKIIVLVNGAIFHLQAALRVIMFINHVLIFKLQVDMSGCFMSCEQLVLISRIRIINLHSTCI
jgi:hypothetical protein